MWCSCSSTVSHAYTYSRCRVKSKNICVVSYFLLSLLAVPLLFWGKSKIFNNKALTWGDFATSALTKLESRIRRVMNMWAAYTGCHVLININFWGIKPLACLLKHWSETVRTDAEELTTNHTHLQMSCFLAMHRDRFVFTKQNQTLIPDIPHENIL